MPTQENVHRARNKAARIGKALVLVLVVLLGLLVLPLGGLILIGLGVYIGAQAHRARARTAADPGEPLGPIPGGQSGEPVRRFFGRKPSYGLSAACTAAGILVFIGGVAVFSNSAPPQDQTAPASGAPAAPAALPDAAGQPAASPESVPAELPVDSAPVPAPASRQAQATKPAQPTKAPEKPGPPQPVSPQPAASQPVAPQPIAPQPVERRPETPQSVAPQPGTSPPVTESGGGARYFKSCDEARAAGAAPLHRGEPGYREGLDRDGDGKACETR